MPIGNRRVQKPKFCHLKLFPVNMLKLRASVTWSKMKVFKKYFPVASFMVLSKICENDTFLKHLLLQVASFLQKMALKFQIGHSSVILVISFTFALFSWKRTTSSIKTYILHKTFQEISDKSHIIKLVYLLKSKW